MNESAKRTAVDMIERLPEDVSYEDIMYELYVLEAIEKGLQDVAEGRVVSHDEVLKSLKTWTQPSGAE